MHAADKGLGAQRGAHVTLVGDALHAQAVPLLLSCIHEQVLSQLGVTRGCLCCNWCLLQIGQEDKSGYTVGQQGQRRWWEQQPG